MARTRKSIDDLKEERTARRARSRNTQRQPSVEIIPPAQPTSANVEKWNPRGISEIDLATPQMRMKKKKVSTGFLMSLPI